jgi:hypothetical protein
LKLQGWEAGVFSHSKTFYSSLQVFAMAEDTIMRLYSFIRFWSFPSRLLLLSFSSVLEYVNPQICV